MELGCYVVASTPLPNLAGASHFWHLDTYPTRAEALDVVMSGSARAYGLNAEQVERYYAFGTSNEVIDKLNAYVAAAAEYFVFQWACRRGDIEDNLKVLATEVLPALRR